MQKVMLDKMILIAAVHFAGKFDKDVARMRKYHQMYLELKALV